MIHLVPKRSQLRAAIIGVGVFGRHHAAKYQRIEETELVGVADICPEARRQATSRFDVPAVADWRDLSGVVDLVSICSPASTHADIVRGFLKAGAHVLVEKPIATDLKEAEDLIALAASRGRVLTVGHQERFVFAKSGLLDYTDVPLAIDCVRTGPWTGRSTDVGVVLDLMIHDLDLVHCLVPGTPKTVRATAHKLHGNFADEVTANLSFADGCEITLFASRVAKERQRAMRLRYPDGVIEIDFLTRKVRNTTGRPLGPLDMEDPLGESVGAFVAAIERGADTLVRPQEARRALASALLIEEAFAQGAQTGRAVASAQKIAALV